MCVHTCKYVVVVFKTPTYSSLFCTILFIFDRVTLLLTLFPSFNKQTQHDTTNTHTHTHRMHHFPHNIIIVFEIAIYALMRRVLNKTCYCLAPFGQDESADEARRFMHKYCGHFCTYVCVYVMSQLNIIHTQLHMCLFVFFSNLS